MRPIALALLSACTTHAQFPGRGHTVYHADVHFSPWQSQQIVEAVSAWNMHLNGSRTISVAFDWTGQDVYPRIERGDENSANAPGVPMVADGETVAGFCVGIARIVLIYPNRTVAEHEIGHSLGLAHDPRPGLVMSPMTVLGVQWTPADQSWCTYQGVCRPR